jgi:putative efflux protein, MATE family
MFRSKKAQILSGNIFINILIYAVPIMISGILQLLFNVIGLVFVGHFGSENAIAAIGTTSQMTNLLVNFIIGLSSGANVVLGKYYGASDNANIHDTVHTVMTISFAGGIGIMVLGLICSKSLLIFMSTPEDILDLSNLYIRIIYLGLPAQMIYNFGAALICATGDSKRPLYFLSAAGVLNIVLNTILVIVFKMDVVGVALATILSQYMSAVCVILYLCNAGGSFKLCWKEMKINYKIVKMVMAVGLPAGFQSVIFSISNLVIQSSINSFGKIVVTGNTAANNIENFVYRAMNAIYQAMLTFYGQNIGAKKYDRLNKILLNCLLIVFLIGFIGGQGVYRNGWFWLHLFTDNSKAINYGLTRLSYVGALYFIYGILEVFIGGIRVLGHSMTSTAISFFGICVFRIFWMFTIFKQNSTLQVLYISFPISWLITLALIVAYYMVISKKELQRLKVTGNNELPYIGNFINIKKKPEHIN